MTTHTFQEIATAARRLHWNHGRGDVREVRVFMDGRIELEVWHPTGQSAGHAQTYRGRLCNAGRSVRMHGRQTRIGFQPQD